MPDFSRKSGAARAASGAPSQPPSDPQLSPRIGVTSSVSSVAIDRGLLPGGRRHSEAGVHLAAPVSYEAMVDADVMLRVRPATTRPSNTWSRNSVARSSASCIGWRAQHAMAEELAQEVFLRVYRSRESYTAEAKFTTWLYRIATNLAVNHARDTKHERTAQNVSLDEPDEETGTTLDVADDEPTVEQRDAARGTAWRRFAST